MITLAVLIIAYETSTSPDPTAWLVNYGVAGVFIGLLATGQFRTKAELAAKDKHIDHLTSEMASKDKVIEAFQLQLTGHTLPALAQSARVLEAIPSGESALLKQLQEARAQAAVLTERLEAVVRGEGSG